MPLMIIDQEGAEEESQGGSHRAKRSDSILKLAFGIPPCTIRQIDVITFQYA
jgi:hypothetical protein